MELVLIILGVTLSTAIVYTLIEWAFGAPVDDDFGAPEPYSFDDPERPRFKD